MSVPYIFATATSSLPLSHLDANFSYFTDAITISSGNVGVGITPSSWDTGYTALQIESGSVYSEIDYPATYLTNNIYFSGGLPRYVIDGGAGIYQIDNNYHVWQTADAGTAGSYASTLIERMRMDPSGNLGIGTDGPTAVLQIKAGTATANTAPLKLTSGTNLTIAEAGAVEYNGTTMFSTGTTASGRGVVLAPMIARVNSSRNKTTNDTSLEAVFNIGTGALGLTANTLYYFKGTYGFTNTASAQCPQMGFIFSNTQQDILYTFSAFNGSINSTVQYTGPVNTAAATTLTAFLGVAPYTIYVNFEGWFKSNATTGGTVIPAFSQNLVGTSVGISILANSWIMIQPMSSDPNATLIAGNWS